MPTETRFMAEQKTTGWTRTRKLHAGTGSFVVVGKSTNGQVFSKAFGSGGKVRVMDANAFARAAGRADRALADADARKK
jgi:hypothetical protein